MEHNKIQVVKLFMNYNDLKQAYPGTHSNCLYQSKERNEEIMQGPAPSPSRAAKPILQSMAGSSIQEVTKDEWGPPADREQTEGEIAS